MAAPIVEKSQTANAGKYQYKYASLADTLRVADEQYHVRVDNDMQMMDWMDLQGVIRRMPVMMTRYRERDKPDAEWSEWSGHVPVMPTGGSNPMQAWGVAMSYAKRYSIQLALGMASEDSDSQPAPKPRQPKPSTEQQTQTINALLKTVGITDVQGAHDAYLNALAGQQVHKASDLNDMQAEQVIAYLNAMMQRMAQQNAQRTIEQAKENSNEQSG
ncbi:ERF family protein [Bifidobacterium eulemuris]|uniref:ERF family protein n=1 Tax=Bifidobacterium eulemuris TaxID=1765219 RepID=A0A261G9Y0_9BIFI|nr:ERF family protein [Bifidobacterium eulemuris]OZG68214.1 hypothetical protein BEUL_1227 [Bifidobacterium eulemuris]QOL31729.1 ERF family protein [Bifidobacterium eulemuris]